MQSSGGNQTLAHLDKHVRFNTKAAVKMSEEEVTKGWAAEDLRVLPIEDTGFHVFTCTGVQPNVSCMKPNSTALIVWLLETDGLVLRLFQNGDRLEAASFLGFKAEAGLDQFLLEKRLCCNVISSPAY
jgi:hypothetical protein